MSRHLIHAMITISWWLNAESCGGGAGGGGAPAEAEVDTTTLSYASTTVKIPPKKVGNITFTMDLDSKDIWNGFEPPPGAGDYVGFIEKYLKAQEEQQKKRGEFGKSRPADAGADFPKEFEGAGPGYDGVEPPPWAFVSANTGQPAFCLQKPDPGNCATEEQTRFAYNPYMDECVAFMWKCRGNNNNFQTKEKCEQQCIGAYEGGCDPSSGIPIGYL